MKTSNLNKFVAVISVVSLVFLQGVPAGLAARTPADQRDAITAPTSEKPVDKVPESPAPSPAPAKTLVTSLSFVAGTSALSQPASTAPQSLNQQAAQQAAQQWVPQQSTVQQAVQQAAQQWVPQQSTVQQAVQQVAQQWVPQQSTVQQAVQQVAQQLQTSAQAEAQFLESVIQSYLDDDGVINRTEMLLIYSRVTADDIVSQVEYDILCKMQNNPNVYPELDYVHNLADAVTSEMIDRSRNLTSERIPSASDLNALVNKWFLGTDNPIASAGYQVATGSLFVHGLSYADIDQGTLGDCYFMAALAELAFRDPNAIYNMFIDNHDGTFTVRFFNNGEADYVTVDRQLPVSRGGSFVYANNNALNDSSAELWTALAEKAYVKIRAKWAGQQVSYYSSIRGGKPGTVLTQITNRPNERVVNYSFDCYKLSAFATLWNAGALLTMSSQEHPSDSRVAGRHAYAVVGYDPATQLITLFNPWGIDRGLLTLSWNAIKDSFYGLGWVAGSFSQRVSNLTTPEREVTIPPSPPSFVQTAPVSTAKVTALEQNVTPSPVKPILLRQLLDRYGRKLPVKWQTGLNEFVKKVETEQLESPKKIMENIQEPIKTAAQKSPVKKRAKTRLLGLIGELITGKVFPPVSPEQRLILI